MTQKGRRLGRYRLEELLGQGGMAEVWRAADERLGRTVAVKVILSAHLRDGHFRERFHREAQLVASLDHPNVLPVYDYGDEDGVPYLVMPYLDGGTLRDRMVGSPDPLRAGRLLDPPARRRPRRGARGGHPPPRRQAGERPDPEGRPPRPRRLRHREDVRKPHRPHRDRNGRRDADLHGARAGAGKAGDTRLRPLRPRRPRVRAPLRQASVRRGERALADAPARDGAGPAPLVGGLRPSRRPRPGLRAGPRQGAGAPPTDLPGLRPAALRVRSDRNGRRLRARHRALGPGRRIVADGLRGDAEAARRAGGGARVRADERADDLHVPAADAAGALRAGRGGGGRRPPGGGVAPRSEVSSRRGPGGAEHGARSDCSGPFPRYRRRGR